MPASSGLESAASSNQPDEVFASEESLALIRRIKSYLCAAIGFPHCSAAFVARNHVVRAASGAEQLEFSKSARARKLPLLAWLVVLSSALFCAKCATLPVVVLDELNFKEPAINVVPLTSRLYRFACIISNCTRLAPADEQGRPLEQPELSALSEEELRQLADELLHLPYFSICHPRLAPLQEPIKDLGVAAMVLVSSAGCYIAAIGLGLPLLRLIYFAHSPLLMFLAAPRAGRRLVLARAHKLARQIQESLANYKRNSQRLPPTRATEFRRMLWPRWRGQTLFERATASSSQAANIEDDGHCDDHHLHLKQNELTGADLELYARDCLTLMRSGWWHRETSRVFLMLCRSYYASVLLFLASTMLVVNKVLALKQARLHRMAEMMQRSQCNMWLEQAPPVSPGGAEWAERVDEPALGAALEPDQLELGVNWWLAHAFTLQLCWPGAAVYFFIMVYALTVNELLYWLAEYKFQLELALEFARQLSGRPRNEGDLNTFSMESLRRKFSRLMALEPGVPPLRSVSLAASNERARLLNSTLACERLVAHMIETEHLGAGAIGELLEKLYIGFRILAKQVHGCEGSVSIMMLMLNFCAYGFIAINMTYMRLIDQFFVLPLGLVCGAFSFVNVAIMFTSNFHAKANKLQPLLWSLIAATSTSEDLRVRHMRALWLKQVQALDMDGGLALKAYGIRITYLRIIQLVIALGTMAVFILRQ